MAAATYYVDPAGSDSNSGLTPALAWQTLSKVNAHSYVAGDTMLFKGGATFTGGLTITTSGSSGLPITFGSYGTGVATISTTAAGTSGFYAHNCGYIVLNNINFTGPGAGATADGVRFFVDQSNTTYQYLRVTNVNVSGYYNGITVIGNSAWHTSPTNGYNDVRITSCVASVNVANGIMVSDAATDGAYSNVYIGYCTAHDNTGDNLAVWSGSGIVMGSTNIGTIEYCSAYNNGATGKANVGIFGFSDTAVTIQFCESYNNTTTSTTDGDGFDFDGECQNCIIQYCYSRGNKGGGFCAFQYTGANTWANNIFRYNISENDGVGISIWGEAAVNGVVTNGQIYNNTVYNSRGPALEFVHGDDGLFHITGFTISNNIFVTTGTQYLVQTNASAGAAPGATFANNDYYAIGTFSISWMGTTYSTLSAWGKDSTGLTSNPLLTNPGSAGIISNPQNLAQLTGYKLQPSSPMIGAGATISSPGAQDFYGNALYYSGQIDIGAHEYTPLLGTGLSVLVYLPNGFNDNHRSRLGEDGYDSVSADPTYIADAYGPRPWLEPTF